MSVDALHLSRHRDHSVPTIKCKTTKSLTVLNDTTDCGNKKHAIKILVPRKKNDISSVLPLSAPNMSTSWGLLANPLRAFCCLKDFVDLPIVKLHPQHSVAVMKSFIGKSVEVKEIETQCKHFIFSFIELIFGQVYCSSPFKMLTAQVEDDYFHNCYGCIFLLLFSIIT